MPHVCLVGRKVGRVEGSFYLLVGYVQLLLLVAVVVVAVAVV